MKSYCIDKSKKVICVFTLMLCILLGCSKKEEVVNYEIPIYTEIELERVWNEDGEQLFENYKDEYIIHRWTKKQTGINSPYGICVLENCIYVADFSGHRIVQLALSGEPLTSYGQLGAEPGNFVNPTAIICHENSLYILDQGNHRIQIFDLEMNYQKEIPYTGVVFSKNVFFHDMAVDQNGTVFLSEWENFVEDAAIYYISDEGTLNQLESHISGVLAEYQGEVYAINTYSLFYVETSNGLARGATFGSNFLFKCTKSGLEQLCELPYKYAAGDFFIEDEVLYAITLYDPLNIQMNRFMMNGKLGSAVYIFEREERDYSNISSEPIEYPWYLDVIDDNHIYAVDSLWKTIYFLEKIE